MLNLPLGIEKDTNRSAYTGSSRASENPATRQVSVANTEGCAIACQYDPQCASWTTNGNDCTLMDSIPMNVYSPGQER
jgi:hypothetical protein